MSSQSTARAPRIRTEPRSAPVKSVAYTYASSPESLWVHSTPGCARLAAIPELSFTRRLCSVPGGGTRGTRCRVRRRRSAATKKIALLGPRQGVIFRPMLAALRSRRVEKLPDQVVLRGRILFLAEDADLVRRQLEGEDIDWRPATKLRDNISTDEITPAYICYYYDETLGDFPYLGLKCGDEFPITRGSVKRGGFVASVSGKRRGKGSSREQSPYAEMCAGIKLVVAENIERIYRENCQNLGVLATTDFSIIDKVRRGEAIPLSAFTAGEGEITRGIIQYGGLFNFNVARLQGKVALSSPATSPRPMTLGEKIIARHWVVDPSQGKVGVPAVKPGDEGFVVTDVRFSQEYVTPMAAIFFEQLVGPDEKVLDPGTILMFRDHLTFLGDAMTPERVKEGLLDVALELEKKQRAFAQKQGIRLYGELRLGHHGSEAICHSKILEGHAEPGMVIIGSDSHTPHAGAVGRVRSGGGTTAIFNSWITKDVRLTVPETVKIVVRGRKRDNVTAKDFMLEILRHPYVKSGRAIGKLVEYCGDAVASLSVDERATMTNMTAEVGGFTGYVAPDERTVAYLMAYRGMSRRDAADDRPPGGSRERAAHRRGRAGARRHRVCGLVHGGQEGRHGHVRARAAGGDGARRARRAVGALLHPMRLAGREALLRGAGLSRPVRESGGDVPRAVVRRLHQRGAGSLPDAGRGDDQRHQPELPRPLRPGAALPGEPLHRGRVGHRRLHHRVAAGDGAGVPALTGGASGRRSPSTAPAAREAGWRAWDAARPAGTRCGDSTAPTM